MGGEKAYTRRAFLRRFAMLSSATMLMGMGVGCGSNSNSNGVTPIFGAMYGPQPAGPATVTVITFLDAQSTQVPLQGSQTVPVHTQFAIMFSAGMLMSSVADAISFVDFGNNPVASSKSWDTTTAYGRMIVVVPDADLSPGASYTLSVGSSALDSLGSNLQVTSDATASFKTAP